jgi:hypothetical protein
LQGGVGGAAGGDGGPAAFNSGNATSGNSNGGIVSSFSGNGVGTGHGGNFAFLGGTGGSTSGQGGGATLTGGPGGIGGLGGNIFLIPGAAGAGGRAGGIYANGVRIPYEFSSVASQNVTNTLAETTLYTFTIQANEIKQDQVLKFYMAGLRTSASGDGSLITYRLKVDGTQILAAADAAAITTTARAWNLQTAIGQDGSNHWYVVGGTYFYIADGTGVGVTTTFSGGDAAGKVAYDPTISHVITITAQWSSGVGASESATATELVVN